MTDLAKRHGQVYSTGTMKSFTSERQARGQLGEDIAVRWLTDKGFEIIERNYTTPQGEIDIIARQDAVLHFIEVKSSRGKVGSPDVYNPGQNLTGQKRQRIITTIWNYNHEREYHGEWQLDALLVVFDPATKRAQVQWLEHITTE